jgi:DNA-binding NtrC family response regulator
MNKTRVLFVDDEEELVTTLVERLGYRGWDADFALSGRRAVEKMKDNPYDIIVLDLKMPGMSGADVMKIIKRDFPNIPVLLITGHGSSVDETDEERPEGAFDYLAKPIKLEDLIDKMQEALEAYDR